MSVPLAFASDVASSTRQEHDSLGEHPVPATAYFGVHTAI